MKYIYLLLLTTFLSTAMASEEIDNLSLQELDAQIAETQQEIQRLSKPSRQKNKNASAQKALRYNKERLSLLEKTRAKNYWLLDPLDEQPASKNPLAQTMHPTQVAPEDFSEVAQHQREFYERVQQRRDRDERIRLAREREEMVRRGRQRAWGQYTRPAQNTQPQNPSTRICTSQEAELAAAMQR